jgi:ATP-dependent Clp protease ATP-binding subunit ClpC
MSSSKTPALDSFSRDLTELAVKGELDPIVGREKEILRVSQILARRKKNNPVLIGEPGVGKTAIAEGLALMIIQKKVSRTLLNKRVVSLDMGMLVAGTKYRGQFEERIKAIMEELKSHRDVIVFIDEIHTMIGAGGSSGSLDASNLFKPALARGEFQCIGATTLNEFRENIEKDGALERRFQKVMIDPPTADETLTILHNIKGKYEDHHNVRYTDEALVLCVKLTERYIQDRFFPDKAFDALDESGSRAQIEDIEIPTTITQLEKKLEKVLQEKKGAVISQDYESAARLRDVERKVRLNLEVETKAWESSLKQSRKIVDADRVLEVVSMMSGIPLNKLSKDESERLMNLEAELASKVIGQQEAVKKISKSIKRSKSGLRNANKPIGSFIFSGGTGTGKTQLAKILSESLFGDKEAMIRVDMSEFMDKFNSTKLIGAPPGYVGHEDGGQLTEKVRRKPYSVVLFDEIEKAHPDVFNMLLQVLDEGFITDGLGRKINFRNTLIIMTTNIGQRKIKDFGTGVGFGTSSKSSGVEVYKEMEIKKELEKFFSPEFLNRIDAVINFKALSKENLFQILEIELADLQKRILDLGLKLKLTDDLRNYLIEQGYDENLGARPLKRVIERAVEDTVSDILLSQNIDPGSTIVLGYKHKEGLEIEDCITSKINKPRKKNTEENDQDNS